MEQASKVKKILSGLFFATIICIGCEAQLEKYIHDLSDKKNGIDFKKLISLLPLDSSKNILILSEANHAFNDVDSVRTCLIREVGNYIPLDAVFFERPFIDYFILKKLSDKSLSIKEVIIYQRDITKSNVHPYLQKETEEGLRHFPFIKGEIDSFGRKIHPIDIGTLQNQFTISALSYLTKGINSKNIELINSFGDSLVNGHLQLFNGGLFSEVSEQTYASFMSRFELFYNKFTENYPDQKEIILCWENLRDELESKYRHREEYKYYEGNRSVINFGKTQRTRDSLMFRNMEKQMGLLGQKWENVILSVSSIHSMRSFPNEKMLENWVSKEYITIGEYLSRVYGRQIKRIALVCYECPPDKKLRRDKNRRRSLEHYLYKRFSYAYVSLSDLRKSEEFRSYSFYLMPTFNKYLKFSWQNAFDGIIFLKNCGCISRT